MIKTTISNGAAVPRRAADTVSRWCESFHQRCKTEGIRITPQRLAVYRAVAADLSHPTADGVHRQLSQEMPALSAATVYRVLDFLVEHGLIRRVSSTDGAGRFDANVAPHQHLYCRRCGAMTDFHDQRLTGLSLPPQSALGFSPELLDIRIVGLCKPCGSAEPV